MAAVGVGTRVGDTYELIAPIGRGGMGVVWRARHLRLPREVAIKLMTLRGDQRADDDAFARFRHEAEIVARLGHPGIVRVLDFNTMAGVGPYIVMELLEGENLKARIARGPLPPAEALRILRELAPALDAAHKLGVVHRDLKPENLFLCREAGAKVLDFGVSKIRGSDTVRTHNDVMLGTPEYMSPEQASGANDQLDQRADVFALGAIVYEMLVGEGAFVGASLAEITYKIVHGPAPALAARAPWLPPDVVRAVLRALAKPREQRFADVPSLVTALAELGETAPGPIQPASAAASARALDEAPTRPASPRARGDSARAQGWHGRRLRWALAAGGLAAVGVVLALALGGRSGQGRTRALAVASAPPQGHRLPAPTASPGPPRLLPAAPAPASPPPDAPPALAASPSAPDAPPTLAASPSAPVAPPATRASAARPAVHKPEIRARPAVATTPVIAPPAQAESAADPAPPDRVSAPDPGPAPDPVSGHVPVPAADPDALPEYAWQSSVIQELARVKSLATCFAAVHAAIPSAQGGALSVSFRFEHGHVTAVETAMLNDIRTPAERLNLYWTIKPKQHAAELARAVEACAQGQLLGLRYPAITTWTRRVDFIHQVNF